MGMMEAKPTEQHPKRNLSTAIGVGQIVAMLLGFGSVIYSLGVKGEQLDRARADMASLSGAVADLASAQASAAVADAKDKTTLEDVKRRLDVLERRMDRGDR